MGERKVLNKYIPVDFDPRLIPRSKKPKDQQVSVRMMLPFTIQCKTCSTFLYRGRKFNSKKEDMKGAEGRYLGIQRFRFYIKCSHCSMPITFLTDPQNTDYEMESGGTRNYEVWKDKEKTEDQIQKDREDDDKVDSMRALENRVLDSQREMAELDALDEIKAMNMRHAKLGRGGFDVQTILETNFKQEEPISVEDLNENGLTENEEALVKAIKFGSNSQKGTNSTQIRRLKDEDDEHEIEARNVRKLLLEHQQNDLYKNGTKALSKPVMSIPIMKTKRKRTSEVTNEALNKSNGRQISRNQDSKNNEDGLSSLLGEYGSSDDSDL